MMNSHVVLGVILLLLPVPLSFLIPASPQASPDPWRVRRARLALIRFALFVAVTQIALLAFQNQLGQGSPPGGGRPMVWGLFVWVPMSWLFLLGADGGAASIPDDSLTRPQRTLGVAVSSPRGFRDLGPDLVEPVARLAGVGDRFARERS